MTTPATERQGGAAAEKEAAGEEESTAFDCNICIAQAKVSTMAPCDQYHLWMPKAFWFDTSKALLFY